MNKSATDVTLKDLEDNPWYLLATLHSIPGGDENKIIEENRITWNRYCVTNMDRTMRVFLKNRIQSPELKPFTSTEIAMVNYNMSIRSNGKFSKAPDFSRKIDFSSCRFKSDTKFNGYIFPIITHFTGSSFDEDIDFSKSVFIGDAYFLNCSFSKDVRFSNSTFKGNAYFRKATFSGDARFSNVQFFAGLNFINADMQSLTSFLRCAFKSAPPRFAGAKLHEGTVWREATWPPAPSTKHRAGIFTASYERLKLEMDRLKKHEEELFFFAKELECRRIIAGPISGFPITLYGILCRYGQSFLWPLSWLAVLILLGAWLLVPALNNDWALALGVSTANTLGSLGLRKELVDPDTLRKLARWQQVVSGAQTVIGLTLLFLIGLGLRNRFRMK